MAGGSVGFRGGILEIFDENENIIDNNDDDVVMCIFLLGLNIYILFWVALGFIA